MNRLWPATPSCPGGTARPIVSDNVRTYRLDPNLGVLISSIGMRQMPAPSSRVTEIEQCSPINSGRFTHGACELYGFDLSSGSILEIMDTVVRNETGIDQLEIVQRHHNGHASAMPFGILFAGLRAAPTGAS